MCSTFAVAGAGARRKAGEYVAEGMWLKIPSVAEVRRPKVASASMWHDTRVWLARVHLHIVLPSMTA